MTLPSRAPFCLKCQEFTNLEHGGTECETCGSTQVEMRTAETPASTPEISPASNDRPPQGAPTRSAADNGTLQHAPRKEHFPAPSKRTHEFFELMRMAADGLLTPAAAPKHKQNPS